MTQPPFTPAEPVPAEIRSTLMLIDYYRQWHRHRVLFVGGLLVVALAALVWVELQTPYYRAKTSFLIADRIRPENLVTVEKLIDITANEQYRSAVNGVLADQYLHSNDLLLEATEQLAAGADGGKPVDLYELLDIKEPDQDLRKQVLCNRLKRDLIKYEPIQNSGVFEVSAELPDRYVAARLANVCIELLKQRFVALYFEGFDKALVITQDQFEKEQQERSARAAELSFGDTVDLRPAVAQKQILIAAYMEKQAERLATMADKIQGLRMITSDSVKQASQPIKVMDRALAPLNPSRPIKLAMIVLVCLIYTFVFMLGLMFKGYALAAMRQMDSEKLG